MRVLLQVTGSAAPSVVDDNTGGDDSRYINSELAGVDHTVLQSPKPRQNNGAPATPEVSRQVRRKNLVPKNLNPKPLTDYKFTD